MTESDYRWVGLVDEGQIEIGQTAMGDFGVWRNGALLGVGGTVVEALDAAERLQVPVSAALDATERRRT